MNKHAYCIIAHADPDCLRTLLSLLDDSRNDIYLLIDRKSDRGKFGDLRLSRARLTELPRTVDIRWGDISMVEAELELFGRVAASGENYSYVHLLSGADLPLKSQDYIHAYCESLPAGTNLVSVSRDPGDLRDLRYKTIYRHYLNRHYKSARRWRKVGMKTWRLLTIIAQQALGIRKSWKGYTLGKGDQWGSMSMDFVRYLVERKEWILREFKYVFCADEIYKQTLLLSSPMASTRVVADEEREECKRAIDWGRGAPYTWRREDCEGLLASDKLFGRKFSTQTDRDAVEFIRDSLLGEMNHAD